MNSPRTQLYFWFKRRLGVPEGSVLPWYMRAIRFVIFPVATTRVMLDRHHVPGAVYRAVDDTVEFQRPGRGHFFVRYSLEMLAGVPGEGMYEFSLDPHTSVYHVRRETGYVSANALIKAVTLERANTIEEIARLAFMRKRQGEPSLSVEDIRKLAR